jgi:uncharacterized repeat protein (TIGR01451 family)
MKSGTWVDSNADGFADVGEPVNYTFTVSNTGNVTLYNVTVTDPLLTVSGGPLFSLAVGGTDSTTFTGVYYLTQADIDAGQVYNEATADAEDPDGAPVSDIDDEMVYLPQNPELTLLKEAMPVTYDAVGDEITYTYTLTNSGNVTLSGPFTVDDDKATTSRVGAVPVPDELAPGDHITFTATYTIDQDDIDDGSVKNIAQGFGYFDDEIVESNEDDETVTSVPAPELTLVKLATPVTYDAVGDEITYTYRLTNTGNVTLMGPFSVDDDKATVTPVGMLPMVLAPDAYIDFEATYTITQADLDAGSVTNIARGHGYYNQEPVHSNYDDETVTAIQNPELTLLKEAMPVTYDAVGDEITYTYTLTNSGNVTLSGPFTVDDDKATTSRVGAVPVPDELAPGDHITFTATYTIDQDDIDDGSVKNIAQGFGYFDDEIVESNEDDETVTSVPAPELTLVKLATPVTYDAVGDEITYTYRLTNTGNVTLMGPFSVDDDKATVTPVGMLPMVLAPDAYIDFEATYTITQADLDAGSVTNIARGHGYYNQEPVHSNYDDETVTAIQNPELTLLKEAMPVTYDAVGDEITYTYTLTNSGNVTLSGPFTVDDDKATTSRVGAVPVPDELAPGDHIIFTATYTITQDDLDDGGVTNIARGHGYFDEDEIDSNEDDETVTAEQAPALTLVKLAMPVTYDAVGDEITYTYTLTNSGNVTLSGPFTVDDDKATTSRVGAVPVPDELAPGDHITFTATYTIDQDDIDDGSVKNIAQGFGYFDDEIVESNEDDETVTSVPAPELTLVKLATPVTYDAVGDEITYTYRLTNTGNVTLMGPFSVDDDKATVTPVGMLPMVLAPDAYIDFEATYTITQADLDAGSVTNIARGHGYYNQEPVHSNYDDETVTAIQNPELTLLKEAMPVTYDAVGDEITYTYTLTNSGNVTLSGPFTVDDDKATTSRVGAVPVPDELAPGDHITFTATYTIDQDDIDDGSVKNIAQGFGYFDDEIVESNEDDETVTSVPAPELTLVKLATPVTYDAVGDEITYTYRLTNTGNVTLMGPFSVDDDKATVTPVGMLPMVLAPDAYIDFEATYTITQADLDAGSVTNIARGHGYYNQEPVHSNYDDETVTAIQNPELTLLKEAMPVTYDAVGDEITYTYTLTNSGNVTLSGPFTVDDDKATTSRVGAVPVPDELAPGDHITFTATYTITQADLDAGSVTNIAQGFGYFDDEIVESNEDDETVTAEQAPALTLVKTAAPVFYDSVGDVITYTYTLTNSGNVTLSGPFTVDDDKATTSRVGAVPVPDVLAPGGTITFTATYVITQADLDNGSVTNIAQGHGFFGETPVDSNYDDETVIADEFLGFPDLGVKKSADRTTADPGDTITYTIVVTNFGSASVSGYTLVDTFDQRYLAVIDAAGGVVSNGKITWTFAEPLAAGASRTITYKMLVSENMPNGTTYLDNVVVVSHPDDDNPDNDRSTWRVTVEEEPFLPFTGADLLGLLALAGAAAATGATLRRRSRKDA